MTCQSPYLSVYNTYSCLIIGVRSPLMADVYQTSTNITFSFLQTFVPCQYRFWLPMSYRSLQWILYPLVTASLARQNLCQSGYRTLSNPPFNCFNLQVLKALISEGLCETFRCYLENFNIISSKLNRLIYYLEYFLVIWRVKRTLEVWKCTL